MEPISMANNKMPTDKTGHKVTNKSVDARKRKKPTNIIKTHAHDKRKIGLLSVKLRESKRSKMCD